MDVKNFEGKKKKTAKVKKITFCFSFHNSFPLPYCFLSTKIQVFVKLFLLYSFLFFSFSGLNKKGWCGYVTTFMFIHLFPFEGNEAENLLRRLTNLFTVFSSLFPPSISLLCYKWSSALKNHLLKPFLPPRLYF